MSSQQNPAPASIARKPASGKSASVWEIYFPMRGPRPHAGVYVASFPPIIYFWPTILVCLFAAAFQGVSGAQSTSIGWLAVVVLSANFIVLAHDFDQKQFIIFLLFLMVTGLILWILNLYGYSAVYLVGGWILNFRPSLSTDAYLLVGGALAILFVWGIITPRFNYWKLEQNEFVHYSQPAGRDVSIARAQCSIYKEIPDVFESILLGGGGSLVIRRNDQILATIHHIPFLGMRMASIEHLLAETRVVVERSDG